VSKILLGAAAAAAMILATSGASATGVTLGNITVFDYGQVSATAPDFAQPGVPAPTAQIEIGQVTGSRQSSSIRQSRLGSLRPKRYDPPLVERRGRLGDDERVGQRFDHRLGLAQR
jgi:hypothetical protein